MKQITVVSGKGGTGKTSILASLAALSRGRGVIADCDVDAPDLHLILKPVIREKREFWGMKKAAIDASRCISRGSCEENCRFGAAKNQRIDPLLCEGCGVCSLVCPADAITMEDQLSGYAFISDTRFGPLVHAELFPGEEASGKLVTMVREISRELAQSHDLEMVLIDGSPGIGCPVIASLTGSDLAIVVTEPTISGAHDLDRILGLVCHFGIEPLVCINKFDLNPEAALEIEERSLDWGAEIIGRIPFDPVVVEAMVIGLAVVEMGSPVADAIVEMMDEISSQL